MLGSEVLRKERSVKVLLDWAAEHQICVPEAFMEWAKLDDGHLLGKYSNCDSFYFDEPELVITPDGLRGLLFNQESQHNFQRIVCLDQGDDPPVLFAWLGDPPWVMNVERFSDAVYAQVFDWQYWLDFPDDPARGEIAYSGELYFETESCLSMLRERYEEAVTTSYIVDDIRYREYRFIRSPDLRLTVVVAENDSTAHIRVTGSPMEMVQAFEAELKSSSSNSA